MNRRIGTWNRYDEAVDESVVQQVHGNWCVLACAEMLTDGRITQQQLSKRVAVLINGTDVSEVAAILQTAEPNNTWQGGYVDLPDAESALSLLNAVKPWGAVLRMEGGHHMVLVDGIDDENLILIRDPYNGTRYRVEQREFTVYWNQIALFVIRG